MKQDAIDYCKQCPKCGSYYIEVIGERCRCPNLLEEERNFEQEMAAKWLEGELVL